MIAAPVSCTHVTCQVVLQITSHMSALHSAQKSYETGATVIASVLQMRKLRHRKQSSSLVPPSLPGSLAAATQSCPSTERDCGDRNAVSHLGQPSLSTSALVPGCQMA